MTLDPPLAIDPAELHRTADHLATQVPPVAGGDFATGWVGAVNALHTLADTLTAQEGAGQ